MTRIANHIEPEAAPTGKRTVRRSAHGNLIGYIGGRRWEVITCGDLPEYSAAEAKAAEAWMQGRDDWRDAPFID